MSPFYRKHMLRYLHKSTQKIIGWSQKLNPDHSSADLMLLITKAQNMPTCSKILAFSPKYENWTHIKGWSESLSVSSSEMNPDCAICDAVHQPKPWKDGMHTTSLVGGASTSQGHGGREQTAGCQDLEVGKCGDGQRVAISVIRLITPMDPV